MWVGAVYLLLKIVKTPMFSSYLCGTIVPTVSHPPAAKSFGRDKSLMCLHRHCEAHRHDRIDMKIPLKCKFCRDSKNGLQNEI